MPHLIAKYYIFYTHETVEVSDSLQLSMKDHDAFVYMQANIAGADPVFFLNPRLTRLAFLLLFYPYFLTRFS